MDGFKLPHILLDAYNYDHSFFWKTLKPRTESDSITLRKISAPLSSHQPLATAHSCIELIISRRAARNHNFEVVLSHDASTNISSAILLVLKPIKYFTFAQTYLHVANYPSLIQTLNPAVEIMQLVRQSASSALHPLYFPTMILAYLSKHVAREMRLLMGNLSILEGFTGVVQESRYSRGSKPVIQSIENAHERLATIMAILDSWSIGVDSRLLTFIQEMIDAFKKMPEDSRPEMGLHDELESLLNYFRAHSQSHTWNAETMRKRCDTQIKIVSSDTSHRLVSHPILFLCGVYRRR